MPRHATGLGGKGFPAASKILQRYEGESAYRKHQQKLASMKHRLDVKEPKKYPHLILRLKQIQKEEERQAEIDHENKLLLNRMTQVMKYGGTIDNWNSYESRSLNFPMREKQNENIARENMGIARRLETVKPQLRKDQWDKDYRKHTYLKRLWGDSVKDYGEFSPRRLSRMSRAVKRSLDNSLDDTLDDQDLDSEVPSEDNRKRLPRLDQKSKAPMKFRSTKSESGAPTKLPKIHPSRKKEPDLSMYYGPEGRNKSSLETERSKRSSKSLEDVEKSGERHRERRARSAELNDDMKRSIKQEEQPVHKPAIEESDVGQLFKVAKQMARPDDIIIKQLIKKSYKQRMQTKAKFRQKYDLDLITELKDGLGIEWEHLIDSLLQERGVADSYAIFDALSAQDRSKTSDMSDVVELLCSRDNAAIADLKESYRKEFSVSLEEDIIDRSKPPVQTLLLALQKGHADESTDIDSKEVWDDALALHESGEGCWTSESGKFLRILTEKSTAHLKAVFDEYKAASSGTDVLEVVKTECPKDYYLVMVTLVNLTRSPDTYFAEELYKHRNPTDPLFVTLLVTRSEVDMPVIRRSYKKKYHADLVDDIKSKPHPTTKCLIELASKVPPGMRAKETGTTKKTATKTAAASSTQAVKKSQPAKKQEVNAQDKGQQKKMEPATQKSKQPDNASVSSTQGNKKPDQQSKSKPPGDSAANQPSQPIKREHQTKQKAETSKQRKEETMKEDGNHNGTVKPVSNFNPDSDCDRLHAAMSGLGTDESVIVDIIPHRSNRQRQELKKRYEQKFKKNLMIDLESELRGDFEEIILALMMTPVEYDAYCMHEAVDGLGTSEATLIGILCSRSGADIKAIKDYYKKAYKTDMERDIAQDVSGDFEKMVLELCKGQRTQGSEVNMQQAQADAKALYRNGEIALDPNGDVFTAILTKKNCAQVRATFQEYKKLTGHDIYVGITKAMLGDDEDGYIGLAKAVEDPVQFYAERLHSCFSGLGTNDNMLIRIIVSRAEIDLKDIKGRYYELYGKTLSDSIQKECNGDYKRILLAILADKPDGKDKGTKEVSKPTTKLSGPTLFPADPFNPDQDCVRIHDGMKGFGTDEAVLVEILPARSNQQRQGLKECYQKKYDQNLMIELESELSGDFEELVLALMMTPTHYDAHCLHEAMAGLGTSEAVLIGILCTRSSKELEAIKAQYKNIYGKELETAIRSDTGGDLEELLVELLKGERIQGSDVNVQEAKSDAKKLYKDGQISIDPKDETFRQILVHKHKAQVKATFEEYKKLAGNDVYQGIEKAFTGETEAAYLSLAMAVEDPVKFYAMRLHDCFRGIGTNDNMLIRIVVSRSEIDLADIKTLYESLYKEKLSKSIEGECSAHYKRMLLAVVGDK